MTIHAAAPRGVALALFLTLGLASSLAAAPLRIGSVADGDARYLAEWQAVFEAEIRDLTSSEFDVSFPEDKQLRGDWTLESAGAALDRLLADESVDLVLAFGVLTGYAAAHHADFPKPVLAPLMLDPALQDLPWADGASGVSNFSYVAFPVDYAGDLKTFREIFGFQRAVLLADAQVMTELPALAEASLAEFAKAGVDGETVLAGDTAESALMALPEGTRVVCLGWLPQLDVVEMQRLLDELLRRRIAAFSLRGRVDVEMGALASLAPNDTLQQRARLTALQVQAVLLGENPSVQLVGPADAEELIINMRTVRAIGAWPSRAVLTEAELLHEEEGEAILARSLESSVREALESNRDLALVESFVRAGAEDVKKARAARKPQLSAGMTAAWIDPARAGLVGPERGLTGSLGLKQVLYSEPINASIVIEQHGQVAREQQLRNTRLDVALEAAQAYLDVLRAQTLTRVRRDDVRLTRASLQLARLRFDLGASSQSDVLRWESELAVARGDVLDALAQRSLAQLSLNRILHRPLEEKFSTREPELAHSGTLAALAKLRPYLNDSFRGAIFRDFMAAEALANAPELLAPDELIAAQERLVTSKRRAFYSPSVILGANFAERLADAGDGSDPLLGSDSSWDISVTVGLPLYSGGARAAEFAQARENLEELKIRRDALAERLDLRVRANLHLSSSSFNKISLADEAASAARGNLELVREGYARGAMNIVQLLDAQNAAVTAEEGAANAVHDFLFDLLAAQRAVGTLDMFWSPVDKDAWFDRMKTYYEKRGVEPRSP